MLAGFFGKNKEQIKFLPSAQTWPTEVAPERQGQSQSPGEHVTGLKELPEIIALLTHGENSLFPVEKYKLPDGSSAAKSICAIDIGLNRAWILIGQSHRQALRTIEVGIQGRLVQTGKKLERTVTCADGMIASLVQDWQTRSKSDIDVSKSPGLSYFRAWLQIAARERAGDLHLAVRGNKGFVNLRVDTEVIPLPGPEGGVFSRTVVEAAIADCYGLLRASKSGQSTDFHRERGAYAMLPSDKLGMPLRVRYQYVANIHGGNAALRLLPEGAELAVQSLEEAGFAPNGHIDELAQAARSLSAGIVLAGVTGSGKTTLVSLVFRTLIDPKKLICYEFGDPIEILNESIYQVSAVRDVSDDKDKSEFLRFSAETMRGDPDVICIGETRDFESRALFEKAALSGHLAVTTLHAKFIPGIPARFSQEDIGLTRDKMGSSELFGALAYLALEPKLCPVCRVPAIQALTGVVGSAEEQHLRQLILAAKDRCGLEPERLFYRRIGGCPECKNRGTRGVTNLAEVFRPNARWRALTRDAHDEEAFEVFREESDGRLLSDDFHGKPAFVHGLYKAAHGLLDLRSLAPYGDLLRYSQRERA